MSMESGATQIDYIRLVDVASLRLDFERQVRFCANELLSLVRRSLFARYDLLLDETIKKEQKLYHLSISVFR